MGFFIEKYPYDVTCLHYAAFGFAKLATAILKEALDVEDGRLPAAAAEHCIAAGGSAKWICDAAERAKPLGDFSVEDMAFTAYRLMRFEGFDFRYLPSMIRNEAEGLALWGGSGAACKSLRKWRASRTGEDLPPLEYVAFHLACDWNRSVDKHSREELACSAGTAFTEVQITVTQVQSIVDGYWGHTVTPELGYDIAEASLDEAMKHRA